MAACGVCTAIRDAGEAMTQTVQEASNALALNQDVYKALVALNVSAADPATRHYVERTLLDPSHPGYVAGGVGRLQQGASVGFEQRRDV